MKDAELQSAQPAAFDTAQKEGMFQEQGCLYAGNLKADCADAMKSTVLQAHSDFCVTHALPNGSVYAQMAEIFKPRGDGKRDEARDEMNCNGFYSRAATGRS